MSEKSKFENQARAMQRLGIGVAVLNGLVLVSFLNQLREEGTSISR